MSREKIVRTVSGRLSLREPQSVSLERLHSALESVPALRDSQARSPEELAAMQAAAAAFVEARRMSLGRDIVPKQVSAALMVPGVYDIELLTPAATVSVPRTAWSACTSISIEVAGLADG